MRAASSLRWLAAVRGGGSVALPPRRLQRGMREEEEEEEEEEEARAAASGGRGCGSIPRRFSALASLALCIAGISLLSLSLLPAMGAPSAAGGPSSGAAAAAAKLRGGGGEARGRAAAAAAAGIMTGRSSALAVYVPLAQPLLAPPPQQAGSGGDSDQLLSGEPVDAVYTWVSASSPHFFESLLAAARAEPAEAAHGIPAAALHGSESAEARARARLNKYREWGELRYSMRSLLAHADWLRRIYIVTADASQLPSWLNASHPRIRVVHHAALFDEPAAQLPTFNSLAIESVLHRIPGLSNFFLYVNNDLLLNARTPLAEFRTAAAYYRYDDWAVQIPRRCSSLVLTAHTRAPDAPAYAAARCTEAPLVYDAILARWAWGVRITHWQAHVPHLWERRVLREVEARLGAQLAVARRNKLRDARSDVSVHRQYEAWLLAAAAANLPGEAAVVPRPLSKSPAYMFVVFDNAQAPAAAAAALAKLRVRLRRDKPRFVGFEDDLHDPTPEQARAHQAMLTGLMEEIAPLPAPWELDAPPQPAAPKLEAAAPTAPRAAGADS